MLAVLPRGNAGDNEKSDHLRSEHPSDPPAYDESSTELSPFDTLTPLVLRDPNPTKQPSYANDKDTLIRGLTKLLEVCHELTSQHTEKAASKAVLHARRVMTSPHTLDTRHKCRTNVISEIGVEAWSRRESWTKDDLEAHITKASPFTEGRSKIELKEADSTARLKEIRYGPLRSRLCNGTLDAVTLKEARSVIDLSAEGPHDYNVHPKARSFRFKRPDKVAEALWTAMSETGKPYWSSASENHRDADWKWSLGNHEVTFGDRFEGGPGTQIAEGVLDINVKMQNLVKFSVTKTSGPQKSQKN